MKKNELLESLEELKEIITKQNIKMLDLFKDEDDPRKTLALLRKLVGRIEFLLEAQDIKELHHPTSDILKKPLIGKKGSLVRVKSVREEHGDKTYVGFLLGEMAAGSSIEVTEDNIILDWANHNPAIFVPELGEVIMGYESWWSTIKSVEELEAISDDDIQNTWYVKLMKQTLEKEAAKKESE